MANTTTTRKRSTKAAKPVEPEEELDEVTEDEAAEQAPAAKDEVFGVAAVCELIQKRTGKTVKPRELRTLIRKMARDGSGRVEREIVAGNKERYTWSGPKDPEVRAIVKAFTDGELEADKREKLAALKERKAAQKAEADKAAAKKAPAKKAAAVVEDDDEDLDDDE